MITRVEKAILTAGAVVVAACIFGAQVSAPSAPEAARLASAVNRHAGGPLGALTADANCTLEVPPEPLSARGLATPYVLHSAGDTCSESAPGTAAFVQAVIFDPRTGNLEVYNPVVVNPGDKPATVPPVPKLPRHAVVSVWTGFNGDVLKLTGRGANRFVNFAQQSYANSPQFFQALSRSVRKGTTAVPPLGTDSMGDPCPTTRDFSVVDQDQSDNVTVGYPQYGTVNGSDDSLLTYIDAALGCKPWTVPVAFDAGGLTMSTAGQLEEMQAALEQAKPVALVPGLDPFVTRNGQPDLFLLNLYRRQLGQPMTRDRNGTKAYCANLASAGASRLAKDAPAESAAPIPPFGHGANLAAFLAARFQGTWANLTCEALTGMPSPITVDAMGNITYP